MPLVTRLLASSEQAWDPMASSSVNFCRKTRTVRSTWKPEDLWHSDSTNVTAQVGCIWHAAIDDSHIHLPFILHQRLCHIQKHIVQRFAFDAENLLQHGKHWPFIF
jgi:hypothetical protein